MEAYSRTPVHDLGLLLAAPSPPGPSAAAPASRRRRHDFSLGGGKPQGVLVGRSFHYFLWWSGLGLGLGLGFVSQNRYMAAGARELGNVTFIMRCRYHEGGDQTTAEARQGCNIIVQRVCDCL